MTAQQSIRVAVKSLIILMLARSFWQIVQLLFRRIAVQNIQLHMLICCIRHTVMACIACIKIKNKLFLYLFSDF